MSSGKITQVIGPVVDVAFAAGDRLPEINNALVVYKNDDKKSKIVCYDIVPFRADTRKNKNFEAARAISAKQTLKEKAPVVE